MSTKKNPWLLFFNVFNALLAAIITSTIVPSELLFSASQGSFFLGLALPGHFFFVSMLIFVPLLLLGKIDFVNRKLTKISAFLYSIFIITVFINAQVFELYRFHLNGMVLNLVMGGEVMQILSIPIFTWLSIIVGLAVLILMELFLAKWLFSLCEKHLYKTRWLWLASVLVMATGQIFYAYNDALGNQQVTSMLRYIPWAQPVTAKRQMRKMGVQVVADNANDLSGHKHSSLNYPKNPLVCENTQSQNIVMLVLDSVRYDMFNEVNMPNSYRLKGESWVFNDHYSTGNSTRFGIFGLAYGLPGSYWFSMLGEQKSSVFFDQLVKQDYQLYITATASWSSPEFDRTAFSSIKERVVSGKTLKRENPTDKRHIDSIVTDDFINKITNRDVEKPFFGLLFLDAAHNYSRDSGAPAKFQPELEQVNYLELDNDYDATRFLNRYKNSVYYNDLLVDSIIETLKKQKVLNNTVLIITSDHGQEFNENKKNYWGHNGNFSKYQTKIPLLIRWPNESTHVVQNRTSNEDIVPTLLTKSMGCSNSISDYSTGQNLYSENYQSKPLLLESWSRRALMTDDRIYVFESYGGTQIYDHDYQQIENEAVGNKPLMEAMKMMGEFLH